MKALGKLRLATLENGKSLLPDDALPIVETLEAFKALVSATMSYTLNPNYKELILKYKTLLSALPDHMKDVCGQKPGFTWKEHILVTHLEPWLDAHKVGLAKYSEQASESIHHVHEVRNWANLKVPEGHKDYAKRVLWSVVKGTSNNL